MDKISGVGIQCNKAGKFFGIEPIIVNLKDAEVVEKEVGVDCITYMNRGVGNLSPRYFYDKGYGFMTTGDGEMKEDATVIKRVIKRVPGEDTFSWNTYPRMYFTLCKYGVGQDLYALVPKEWEKKATGGYKRKKKRKSAKRKSAKRKSAKRKSTRKKSKQRKYKKTRRRR